MTIERITNLPAGAPASTAADAEAFRDFFENAPIAMHWLGADGTILRANAAELESLGYTAEEYVGHHAGEFHVDPDILDGIFSQLKRGEIVRDQATQMRCKDGSAKAVRIDASALRRSGVFIHARCLTRDDSADGERDRLFEEAARAAAEMALASAAKDDAVAAHQAMEEKLTLLVEASGQLIQSLDEAEMLPQILRLSRGLIAADAYAVWSLNPSIGDWTIAHSEGLSEAYMRHESTIPVDADTPRPRTPLMIADVESEPMVRERVDGYHREGIRSLLVLPVLVQGEPHTTLTFYSRVARQYSEIEVRVGMALANLAASAITTGRLYEAERAGNQRISEANRRLRFLSEASAVLADSLDYQTTLQNLARLSVPWLADWCGINVMEPDGRIADIAVAHADPAKVQMALELQARYPADPDALHGYQEVFRTGRLELIEDITDEMLVESIQDEEQLRIARSLGLTASLCVPLIAQTRVIGAITFVMADRARAFQPEDVTLIEELACRAAAAIDNAQIYRRAQDIAADLERANEAKDDFLGMVSHELKTPITTILGNAEVLLRRSDLIDEEMRREALDDIGYESRRLHRLIENLLVLSRLEAGITLELEPMLVRRDIERIVGEHERRFPNRVISLDLPEDLPPVCAEPTYFEQVLQNLISNAEKYSPRDQPIDVRARLDGAVVHVSVLDRGPGIPAADCDRIFEPFVRLKRTSAAAGAGIGLAVCKRLMEVQRGSIEARPRDGGGLQVTFTLPLDATVDAIA